MSLMFKWNKKFFFFLLGTCLAFFCMLLLCLTPAGMGVYRPHPRRRTVSWGLSVSIPRSQCGWLPQNLARSQSWKWRDDAGLRLCLFCVLFAAIITGQELLTTPSVVMATWKFTSLRAIQTEHARKWAVNAGSSTFTASRKFMLVGFTCPQTRWKVPRRRNKTYHAQLNRQSSSD